MDSQDQRNLHLAGHENHGVHLCGKCGWPFPNPHPSAKNRRAHKRICGTVEGYKLVDSGEHAHVSDDERGSDEDRRLPSTKIVQRSPAEFSSGGVGERSNRSEDEVFSDCVTELSDSGFSPAYEELFEGVRVSDKNEESVVEGDPVTPQQLQVDASAGIQLPNSPTDKSEMHNPHFVEIETILLGNAVPLEPIVSECDTDLVVSNNSRTDVKGEEVLQSDSKSETLSALPKEDGNGSENVVGDREMQSSTLFREQETYVPGNEVSSGHEILSEVADTPSKTASEASEIAMDLKNSEFLSINQIVEQSEDQCHDSGPTMSLHALSPEVKSFEHTQFSDNIVGSHSDSGEAANEKKDGNGNELVFPVPDDLPGVDHPDILIEGFKDHKARQSNLDMTLASRSKESAYEEKSSSFQVVNAGESTHISSSDPDGSEVYLKEEDGDNQVLVPEMPVEKEADKLKEAPSETTMTGESQTDSLIEGQKPHDIHSDLLQDILPESIAMGLSNVILADVVGHGANVSGSNNAGNGEEDRNEKCVTGGKESTEAVNEELSTNKQASVSDQTRNELGASNSGDHEKGGTEFSGLDGNESRYAAVEENLEMDSKLTTESPCNLSESKDDGMDNVMKNFQENETTTHFVSDSTEVGPGFQNQQDEYSQEDMIEPQFNSTTGNKGVKSNHESGSEELQTSQRTAPEHILVVSDCTIKSSATVDDTHRTDGGFGASGTTTENMQEEGHENLTKPPIEVPAGAVSVDLDGGSGASGITTENMQADGHENLPKQPIEVPAADVSVDSSSQNDSLEGNCGSISGMVISTQSDAPAQSEKVNLENAKTTSKGHHSDKTEVFEAPSFMTLVEPQERVAQESASSGIQTVHNTQQPKSEALQAGWFPSLANVVNESAGRKKNEEIIAKVTNWSAGKPHTPLKSLLGEANLEAKQKSLNPKQTPSMTKGDESTAINNNGLPTTVNSILGPEAPNNKVAQREAGNEWNSPASYQSDDKKEKRKVKGKPYWVPFVCCSTTAHQ